WLGPATVVGLHAPEEARGRQQRRDARRRQRSMKSPDPARGRLPRRECAHMPQLQPAHALEKQPVPARRRADERAVPRGGARRRMRKDPAIDLYFPARLVQETPPPPPPPRPPRPRAQSPHPPLH